MISINKSVVFSFIFSICFCSFIFANIDKKNTRTNNTNDGIIKILTIGNSFSEDAVESYLYGLFKAEGIPVVIGNMYIGGAQLSLHLSNAQNDKNAYSYRKINTTGVKNTTPNVSISYALENEDWDYISFQQASPYSGLYDTYTQSLPALIDYVKARAKNPSVKYVFHQTWAYAQNSTHSGFATYGNNQMTMYNAIMGATNAVKNLPDISKVIPSGTAIQNVRTSYIGDNLTRDGYHLSIPFGRYVASCTWFQSITGKSVKGNSYSPTGVSAYDTLLAQTAASNAINNPYQITDMSDFTGPIPSQLGKELQSFSVNGRNYDVTTPSNYDANKVYPVVFELHSFKNNKTQMHDQNVVNQQQYISVRPEGKYVDINLLFVKWEGNMWNTWSETNILTNRSNDVAYITAVYNDIKQKMGTTFNPEKVYVYGYSNGGAMAMKMVQETNLFKAAIIRSMSFVSGHNIPATASKIPMIFVHGTNDDTVPYKGGKGKYGTSLLSRLFTTPTFESIKETIQKWANHNGLSNPLEIKYLKNDATISKQDFYFREYSHSTHPLYFFVIEGGGHATSNQFSNANIKRALIRLAKNPKQFGIYRNQ